MCKLHKLILGTLEVPHLTTMGRDMQTVRTALTGAQALQGVAGALLLPTVFECRRSPWATPESRGNPLERNGFRARPSLIQIKQSGYSVA